MDCRLPLPSEGSTVDGRVRPDITAEHHNPADRHEDQEPVSQVRAPAFEVINDFLRGDFTPLGDGGTQMFIFSDAGIGKTSLLMMIRLTHLMAFWPRGYDCLLLKLGEDTLETITAHQDKARTVLLLDALDEDPLAWGAIESRLVALLDAAALSPATLRVTAQMLEFLAFVPRLPAIDRLILTSGSPLTHPDERHDFDPDLMLRFRKGKRTTTVCV